MQGPFFAFSFQTLGEGASRNAEVDRARVFFLCCDPKEDLWKDPFILPFSLFFLLSILQSFRSGT